jgi:hypothetical protein
VAVLVEKMGEELEPRSCHRLAVELAPSLREEGPALSLKVVEQAPNLREVEQGLHAKVAAPERKMEVEARARSSSEARQGWKVAGHLEY